MKKSEEIGYKKVFLLRPRKVISYWVINATDL